jgi:hypothetical protein
MKASEKPRKLANEKAQTTLKERRAATLRRRRASFRSADGAGGRSLCFSER